jgi:hypothetical protein
MMTASVGPCPRLSFGVADQVYPPPPPLPPSMTFGRGHQVATAGVASRATAHMKYPSDTLSIVRKESDAPDGGEMQVCTLGLGG